MLQVAAVIADRIAAERPAGDRAAKPRSAGAPAAAGDIDRELRRGARRYEAECCKDTRAGQTPPLVVFPPVKAFICLSGRKRIRGALRKSRIGRGLGVARNCRNSALQPASS